VSHRIYEVPVPSVAVGLLCISSLIGLVDSFEPQFRSDDTFDFDLGAPLVGYFSLCWRAPFGVVLAFIAAGCGLAAGPAQHRSPSSTVPRPRGSRSRPVPSEPGHRSPWPQAKASYIAPCPRRCTPASDNSGSDTTTGPSVHNNGLRK
jgi:hypothetical protein